MIDDFDIIFSKILLKTNKPNIKKQILFGMLIPLIFTSFYMINAKYTKTAFLSFVILTSFAAFIEDNEIFLVYRDFKVFDIDLNSFRFYKAYLIQRFLKDDFIMQTISVVLISFMLIFSGNIEDFIWFFIVINTYIFTMPINHILGSKYPNMLFPKVIFDTAVVFFLIVGVVCKIKIINIMVNEPSTFVSVIIFLIVSMLCFLLLFILSKTNIKSITKINFGNYYKAIRWLRNVDMEMYKDYLINFQDFSVSVITSVVFYFIMKDSFGVNGSFMTIMFMIVPASFFSGKTKKKYNLTTKDNFFYTDKFCKEDRIYIRKKKMYVIFSEVIVKLIICLILLLFDGGLNSVRILFEILVAAFISSLLQYIIIIRDNRLNAVAMTVVKYIVIFLSMINSLILINNVVYWGYLLLIIVLTLGLAMKITLGREEG